jgi:hypothetical protein
MVKEQVDKELVSSDYQAVLPRHKCKPGTKLKQETGDVPGERVFDVPFLSAFRQAQKSKM